MILTCPQCDTRYRTDAAKFADGGRSVRCAKCGHVWHQMPEPDAADAVPATPAEAEQDAPEPVRSEPVPVIREPIVSPESSSDEIPAAVPDTAPARQGSRLGVLAGWLLLLIVLVGLVGALFAFRQQIVSLWPQSASLYSALGLEANARGIAFQDVAYVKGKDSDQTVLTVTGKLMNISGHELAVPRLRVGLSDAGKREIYHWTFSSGTPTLKPGQLVEFRTRLTSPPPAAVGIEVRFAKEGE